MTDPDTDAASATPETADTEPERHDPGREAAKYRHKLRETETERDTLRGRLEHLQRAEITRVAGEAELTQPAAIWATGAQLGDFLDDDGNVDPVKVKATAQTAIQELGLATRPRNPRPDPGQGARDHTTPAPETTWSTFLGAGR